MNKIYLYLSIILVFSFPIYSIAAVPVPTVTPKTESVKKTRPAQEPQERITILSIIPAQGEPGMTVTLSGSGFNEKATVFLGSSEMPARMLTPKQLSFEIPKLSAGLYALFVKNADGSFSKTYSFSIQPQKPIAVSLSPESVSACTTIGSREVVIGGRNFLEGAQVLFDGGAIRSRVLSSESISFIVPGVRGGIHQVQVKNPEDTVSTTLGLMVETRPEISSVTPGSDFVNYYELNVEGKNFQNGSVLLVDGRKVSGGAPAVGDRDRLIYMDCTRLIYQRHPADPAPKTLRIMVVNPGNEESPVVTVSTP